MKKREEEKRKRQREKEKCKRQREKEKRKRQKEKTLWGVPKKQSLWQDPGALSQRGGLSGWGRGRGQEGCHLRQRLSRSHRELRSMNCTRSWSHLAGDPPLLVSGMSRQCQAGGAEGKSAQMGAAVSHYYPTLKAAGVWGCLLLRMGSGKSPSHCGRRKEGRAAALTDHPDERRLWHTGCFSGRQGPSYEQHGAEGGELTTQLCNPFAL